MAISTRIQSNGIVSQVESYVSGGVFAIWLSGEASALATAVYACVPRSSMETRPWPTAERSRAEHLGGAGGREWRLSLLILQQLWPSSIMEHSAPHRAISLVSW